MCPQHEFINQASASFSDAYGVDSGFNGLKVRCQTLSSEISSEKQYTRGGTWTDFSDKFYGKFMTGFKIKAIKDQYLTGIEMTTSSAPIITKIDFSYNIPMGIKYVPEIIAESTVDNDGSMTL